MPRKFDKGDSAVVIETGEVVKIYSWYYARGGYNYRVTRKHHRRTSFAEKDLREYVPVEEKSDKAREDNLFVCLKCSDKCQLRTRVSKNIRNSDLSICPTGMVPHWEPIKKESMEPLIRRIPPSVCTVCTPHKFFVNIQEFIIHIINHAPEDSHYSEPFTRVVYGKIPKKEED